MSVCGVLSPAVGKTLRRARSVSCVMVAMASSMLRNMEKSRCRVLVRTRNTSVTRPTHTRSTPVTSAHGNNSFTTGAEVKSWVTEMSCESHTNENKNIVNPVSQEVKEVVSRSLAGRKQVISRSQN